jgi:hypothetical protein
MNQDIVTDQWEEGFSQLQKYAEDNGHAHPPKSNWVAKQRQDYAKGRLDPDRKDRLSKLPDWSWDPYTDQWEESFGQLVKFAEDNGHARVPSTHKLAGWVKKQRTACAQGKLGADRKDRLSNVKGWSWDPDGDRWEQGLNRLLAYIKEFGHSLVPPGYKTADDGFGLGQWVKVQRKRYADNLLEEDRKARLSKVEGWVWSAKLSS